jgi:hypothetical protein
MGNHNRFIRLEAALIMRAHRHSSVIIQVFLLSSTVICHRSTPSSLFTVVGYHPQRFTVIHSYPLSLILPDRALHSLIIIDICWLSFILVDYHSHSLIIVHACWLSFPFLLYHRYLFIPGAKGVPDPPTASSDRWITAGELLSFERTWMPGHSVPKSFSVICCTEAWKNNYDWHGVMTAPFLRSQSRCRDSSAIFARKCRGSNPIHTDLTSVIGSILFLIRRSHPSLILRLGFVKAISSSLRSFLWSLAQLPDKNSRNRSIQWKSSFRGRLLAKTLSNVRRREPLLPCKRPIGWCCLLTYWAVSEPTLIIFFTQF